MTLLELKQALQPIIKLDLDNFKLSRGTPTWKTELKNDSETLEEHRLMDGSRIFIEKGKPMKEGETKVSLVFFDPYNKRSKETFVDLFDTIVNDDIKISDWKAQLAVKIKEEKNIDIPPNRMRIREIFSRSPYKVYPDAAILKDACNYLYSGKQYAIQELDEEEPFKEKDSVVVFFQHFIPSTYEFGQRTELVLKEDMPIDDLKKLLSEKYNIPNVGLAKGYGSWPGADLVDVPDLDWDRAPHSSYYSSSKVGTIGSSPLYLRDGDIVYFRNNDEKLKQLTKEEKRKLDKDSSKKR
jgi:hypothetical protein